MTYCRLIIKKTIKIKEQWESSWIKLDQKIEKRLKMFQRNQFLYWIWIAMLFLQKHTRARAHTYAEKHNRFILLYKPILVYRSLSLLHIHLFRAWICEYTWGRTCNERNNRIDGNGRIAPIKAILQILQRWNIASAYVAVGKICHFYYC